ncbi:molybdopterin cofactor-binding domain-containing protein [Massilia sp. W12]|uniref:xanthine dehydrogenase family protein molybdopterin-binding subunit n=1 Tax=Massilia sp. W12 TaxID=3126507 RepID=UPI0030CD5CEB
MPHPANGMARREFLKTLGNGAVVSLSISALPISPAAQAAPTKSAAADPASPAWAPKPGVARRRIDGLPKVLGQKLYARDLAARDFPDWPQDAEYFAYALRCPRVDALLLGVDLSLLPPALKPHMIIDAQSLQKRGLPDKAASMNAPFFTRIGSAPDWYGQPAAILIFADFNTYRRARKVLQFNQDVLRWGAPAAPVKADYGPVSRIVRDDRLDFSFYQTPAEVYQQRHEVVALGVRATLSDEAGLRHFARSFSTQALDPMFMEPESGLAWFDAAQGALHLVMGTQSPGVDIADCATVYDCSSVQLKRIDLICCPPGGGFGGRDASFFAPYLALLAACCDKPLRWHFDRYEQFQVGLKRCPTEFSMQISLQSDGRLRGLLADYVFDSGGERNYSAYVANLAALSSMSCYEIPLAAASAKAIKTRHIIGGSHRGFGGPQAYMAIETLLDEAAAELKIDPFALRRKSLMQSGARNISGAPLQQDLQLLEMMRRLETHPLWRQRAAQQAKKARQGLRYGVGFAMSNQAYGTSMDGMFGAVELGADGAVIVHTPYVDMGNGAATTLGLAPAWGLGRNASSIAMGQMAIFTGLGLHSPGRKSGNNQQGCQNAGLPAQTGEPPASSDPLDQVLRLAGPAAACLGAFHNFHVVQYAAQALFLHSIVPAARHLWQRAVAPHDCQWRQGRLHAAKQADLPALSMPQLMAALRQLALPAYCVAHATFGMRFAQADFALHSGVHDLPLDWLGFGMHGGDPGKPVQRLARSNLRNPPAQAARCGRSVYAPAACLVGLSVNPKTGAIKVEQVVTALSAGRLLSPQIVAGQYHGGVAMALGSLFTEDAPTDASGPGNGAWNLHRYHVPKMGDMPSMELITLPAPPDDNTARAIGEAVFCPTGPALMNALAMACGKRFSATPVTPQQILEALR